MMDKRGLVVIDMLITYTSSYSLEWVTFKCKFAYLNYLNNCVYPKNLLEGKKGSYSMTLEQYSKHIERKYTSWSAMFICYMHCDKQ